MNMDPSQKPISNDFILNDRHLSVYKAGTIFRHDVTFSSKDQWESDDEKYSVCVFFLALFNCLAFITPFLGLCQPQVRDRKIGRRIKNLRTGIYHLLLLPCLLFRFIFKKNRLRLGQLYTHLYQLWGPCFDLTIWISRSFQNIGVRCYRIICIGCNRILQVPYACGLAISGAVVRTGNRFILIWRNISETVMFCCFPWDIKRSVTVVNHNATSEYSFAPLSCTCVPTQPKRPLLVVDNLCSTEYVFG